MNSTFKTTDARVRSLLRTAVMATEEAARLEEMLDRYKAITFLEDDSVIAFEKKFRGNPLGYRYVAIKIGNRWYLSSGSNFPGRKGITEEELFMFLAGDSISRDGTAGHPPVENIYVVTEWVELS